jgi:hypothetical protein
MDHLARNTVGLWARESGKADVLWDYRNDADMAARRKKIAEAVTEMRRKADDVRVRMAATVVARDHALAKLVTDTGVPFQSTPIATGSKSVF